VIETISAAQEWDELKMGLAIGSIVEGNVIEHWPFGVFVEMDGPFVGLIEIPYFREKGQPMSPQEYPEIGAPIRAVVRGFVDRNRQIMLNARPSELRKAAALGNA
jgi:ribosomal protein S1